MSLKFKWRSCNRPWGTIKTLSVRFRVSIRERESYWWLVWHSSNGIGYINKVKLSPVVTGIGDHLWQVDHPLLATQPGNHYGGAMSTDYGFGQQWGRNSKFWVEVCPVTRTVWHASLSRLKVVAVKENGKINPHKTGKMQKPIKTCSANWVGGAVWSVKLK